MHVTIEDFKTGWCDIFIGLKDDQIDQMINALKNLKTSKSHFHFRGVYTGESGVADIEFSWIDNSVTDNMELESNPPIKPNR